MYYFLYLESIMRDGNSGDIVTLCWLIQRDSQAFLHCGHYMPPPQNASNTIASADDQSRGVSFQDQEALLNFFWSLPIGRCLLPTNTPQPKLVAKLTL